MQLQPTDPPANIPPVHDPYAAIRVPDFRRYWIGNFVAVLGIQMQAAALNWEIYRRTDDVFMLGLVGLVQVVPVLTLALLAGHVADRVNRKKIMIAALSLMSLSSIGLAVTSYLELDVAVMYVCLAFIGVARAFHQPAKTSFIPQIVPRTRLSNAVTWSTGAFQLAQMAGPALGGFLLAASGHAWVVFLCEACAAASFIFLLVGVKHVHVAREHTAATLESVGAGVRYVWRTKVVLGAMALDMFGVLLGGATALVPVYCSDILHVDVVRYGWLLSAPAAGAVVMSLVLMHRPPLKKAGLTLLWAVVGFGGSIIAFGLSTSFWGALIALFMTGVFDSVSVVVRQTLIQMQTPDHMRGRVSAISGMFISASNELGEFESGLLAKLTSPVFAVVSGGIGTLIVVGLTALSLPDLRRYGSLAGTLSPEKEAVPTGGESLVETR